VTSTLKTKNFSYFLLSYFFVLFNYPIVRASSITQFFELYGAKTSPQAWVLAIALLISSLALSNYIQGRLGFKKTFFALTFVSLALSTFAFLLAHFGVRFGSFVQFAWKEVYIVLHVHLLLAYANTWLKREDFLKWIGPIGAVGSVGGILGGLLTSALATHLDLALMFWIGQFFVLVSALCVSPLESIVAVQEKKRESPLRSLDTTSLRLYVSLVAAIIFLSQIVINIADFQFSLIFEKMIESSQERAIYLGHMYTATNALTLLFQLAVVPVLLKTLDLKWIHFLIPLTYLICLLIGLNVGVLLSSALFYVYLKAGDYSFFSSSKELLYQPMKPLQKYGAKYFTDMLVYRSSKAVIAGVLIYLQDPEILFWIMCVALLAWMVIVKFIFSLHRKIFP
jgi:AAA family ATP:ADP antiporter